MGNRPKNPELWEAHYVQQRARDSKRKPGSGPYKSHIVRRDEKRARDAAKAFARGVKRAWLEATSVSRKAEYQIKTRYGIDMQAYNVMLVAQAGGCAICGGVNTDGRKLFVDHDHETGAVRALLCHHCNAGLGHFKDTPDRLRLAAAYLERYKCA